MAAIVERWTAHETMVFFGDGGIDICNAPDPERRARLIAAAPELLEALIAAEREIKAFARAFGHGVMTEPTLADARAAIAKATGEAAQ